MLSTRLLRLSVLTGALLLALFSPSSLADLGDSQGQSNSVHMVQKPNDDRGQLTSCLETPSAFELYWKPRVLVTGKTIVFHIDTTVVDQFAQGKVCLTIWLDGIPDPLYIDCRVQVCEDFVKVAQRFLPDLVCPIPKGYHIVKTMPFPLDPTIPLPAGQYKLKAEAWNEAQKHILCIQGDVEIQDPE